jgi:putative membrane protein
MFQISAGFALAADLTNRDKEYLRERAGQLAGDIKIGELATQKASNELVRAFGYRMVNDHKRSLENVQKVAAERKVDLPAEPPERYAKALEKLSGLSGNEFDVQYMRRALHEHRVNIKADGKRKYGTKDSQLRLVASGSHDLEMAHMALANKALASVPAK